MKNTTKLLRLLLIVGSFSIVLFVILKAVQPKDCLSFAVYEVNDGWGYDIKCDDETFIHQPFIPAVTGFNAFKSEDKARETAKFVIKKLRSKDSPELTVAELEALHVVE
jgi:hypothetical protein